MHSSYQEKSRRNSSEALMFGWVSGCVPWKRYIAILPTPNAAITAQRVKSIKSYSQPPSPAQYLLFQTNTWSVIVANIKSIKPRAANCPRIPETRPRAPANSAHITKSSRGNGMPLRFADFLGFLALFRAEKKNETPTILRINKRRRLIKKGGSKNVLFIMKV